MLPEFIDIYMAPVRDNPIVQAMLFAALILILCDMIFGITNALLHHGFSSTKLRHKADFVTMILPSIF